MKFDCEKKKIAIPSLLRKKSWYHLCAMEIQRKKKKVHYQVC